ncbi:MULTISPECIES: glutathione S-transferase family protein [Pseudomonas]|uniref:Glutathione S-transferase n=1 Tax=Pseudomonas auratipiscis TaxID=3115853 RepID=A0AB35X310_9PSED|nr:MULTISPECIES: glutathione S-transferase [unclassified Pseudomonas]MEE1869600.1 glutathione S-transferase [Pseudomonas sp. 120P]MEE1960489.1 glutathione S-transferase [Pseudomonas sp. 119P]
MLKIWGRKNSTNVRKVLWCAEELGLEYESVDAGGAFGLVNEPQYRALNPNGLVPMIEDDGLVLWESNAIVRYLSARYGAESGWYVDDARQRAEADKWMDWTTSSLAVPFRPLFWGILRTPAEQQDWVAINAAHKTCAQMLSIADQALARQPYLSGSELGMGDIPLGCFAYAWFEMPIERPEMRHLRAWYERLQARPAFQAAVMTALT